MRSKYTYNNVNLVRYRRNRFEYDKTNTTVQNVGELVPFWWQFITPGESHKDFAKVLGRSLSSFIKAPIGNLIVDMQYYYVPYRIVWDHWEEFQGANKGSAWANTKEFKIPMVHFPNDLWSSVDRKAYAHTICSYIGIPYGNRKSVNAFIFRAYAMIYNEWFRNQNVQDPIEIPTGDDDVTLTADMLTSPFGPNNIFGRVAIVNKFRDRFTSMLPEPQKGEAPSFPLTLTADIPVHALKDKYTLNGPLYPDDDNPYGAIRFVGSNLYPIKKFPQEVSINGYGDGVNNYGLMGYGDANSMGAFNAAMYPSNLWAVANNLSFDSGINTNDIRMLVSSQVLLERMARSGTRYREILLSQWGVVSSDASLQVPEFLNGVKFPLQYHQVAQTSSSSASSYQANISSFAYYSGSAGYTKSLIDFGVVLGVSCIRQIHQYQQGVDKLLCLEDKFDFYNQVYGKIGEQPVYQYELYSTFEDSSSYKLDDVIGYQEAWSELRSSVSIITGEANSLIGSNSVDVWHFGDVYDSPPVLSDDFIRETPDFVDRTLQVSSSSMGQFIMQYVCHTNAIKVLDLYSVGSSL